LHIPEKNPVIIIPDAQKWKEKRERHKLSSTRVYVSKNGCE